MYQLLRSVSQYDSINTLYIYNIFTMIAKEQDEALRNLFISQTNTSECVYMLIDSNNNYAVLTPEADDKS